MKCYCKTIQWHYVGSARDKVLLNDHKHKSHYTFPKIKFNSLLEMAASPIFVRLFTYIYCLLLCVHVSVEI